MRDREKRRPYRRLATLLCLAVLLVAGTLLARDLLRSGRERAANEALARQVEEALASAAQSVEDTQASEALPGTDLATEEDDDKPLPQYTAMWEENNDMAGWLSISDTKINYPVMYTPDEPEYYLRRAFDGSYAVISDYAKENYAEKHAIIRFDTLTEEREYELVAAFYSKVYTDQDEEVFRYYQFADLSSRETYEEYVRQVKAASLYDTGIEPEYGQRLLTLSTCSSYTSDGRFVVVAVEKAS